MRFVAKTFAVLLLTSAVALPLGLIGLLGLAWYCTDTAPRVTAAAPASPGDVARAMRLLERNDPRRARPGALRTIALTQDELDLVLPHLAARLARGTAQLRLQQGEALLQASLPLPANPFGPWLNLQARLVETDGLPLMQDVRLGRLALPQPVADWLLARGIAWLQQRPEAGPLTDSIQRVQLAPLTMRVAYAWNDDLPTQLQGVLVPPEEARRLRVYQQRLAALSQATPASAPVALHDWLQALLLLAQERAGPKATPEQRAAEQRAALVVLAFHVNGKGLAALAPAAAEGLAPVPRRVQMGGRDDLARHFSISAALAATAGTPLADAVGLYKELEDARPGGSGFSFVDLAADRAGARLGALAVGGAAAQERLQRRLKAGLGEQELLPSLQALPEFLPQQEFQRRYGGRDGPAFKRLQTDIERRIGALALYR